MDLLLLEYFLRTMEFGSINRAAADLNISQPAMSRHIALLEREMGGKLFTRTRNGVTLTSAGQLLADRARPLLRHYVMVKEQVGEKVAGQLAIAVPQVLQNVVTSPFAVSLARQHPNVALRVYDGVSNVLRDYLSAGVVDLCIMPFEHSPNSHYTRRSLLREPLVVIGNPSSRLDAAGPLPLTALNGVKLIMPGRANALRQQVEHALTRKDMQFRLAVEADTLELCLEFARQGIGLTITPASALQVRAFDESLTWAPIKGLFVTWALYENEARSHSEAVHVGRQLLVDTVVQRLTASPWFGAELLDG